MWASPVGVAFDSLVELLDQARRRAEVTHDHPEGIKGAQAVASAVFLARMGKSKEQIKGYIETTFGYDLDTPLDEIRPRYEFHVSCQKSVPQAIRAFLESDDFGDLLKTLLHRLQIVDNSRRDVCNRGRHSSISLDGASPIPTVPQRIASAFAVLCGRYGDVTGMAKQRDQSRQSLYREAVKVVEGRRWR